MLATISITLPTLVFVSKYRVNGRMRQNISYLRTCLPGARGTRAVDPATFNPCRTDALRPERTYIQVSISSGSAAGSSVGTSNGEGHSRHSNSGEIGALRSKHSRSRPRSMAPADNSVSGRPSRHSASEVAKRSERRLPGVQVGVGVAPSRGNEQGVGVGVEVDQTASTRTPECFV